MIHQLKRKLKIDTGKLTLSRSEFQDSIFLLNEGDINMNKMKSSNDIKASTKKGDINYNFEAKPKTHYLSYILDVVKK